MDGEEIRAESHRIECTDVSSALPSPLPLLGHTSGALKTISHLQGWRITQEFMELQTPGQLFSRRAGFAMTTEAMASPQLTMQLMKSTNRQLDVFIHCISCWYSTNVSRTSTAPLILRVSGGSRKRICTALAGHPAEEGAGKNPELCIDFCTHCCHTKLQILRATTSKDVEIVRTRNCKTPSRSKETFPLSWSKKEQLSIAFYSVRPKTHLFACLPYN